MSIKRMLGIKVSCATVFLLALAASTAQAQMAVHGAGTANTIPVWTSSSTQGNSVMKQSGGNINVNGGLTTTGPISAPSLSGNGSGVTNVNAATLGGVLPSAFAQLGAASNTFTGNISAPDVNASNTLTSATVNSTNGYQIGGSPVLSLAGTNNLFVGVGQGASSIGGDNTIVGLQVFGSNTTGHDNVAIGYQAFFSNTEGSTDTAVGVSALAHNVLSGDNTAVGASALLNNEGNLNTALGAGAGAALMNGTANTIVGDGAGFAYKGSESGNIVIGNRGVLGDGPNTNSGVIRIGQDANQGACFPCQTSTFIAGIWNATVTGGSTVIINSSGQLGTVASSRRYKEDIQDMGAASDGLLGLRPVTFRYKKAAPDGSKPIQYGLVAEEVAEVYPDLVVRNRNGEPETVQYYKLDAMLLNEIQKLAKAHAADQAEIAQLQSQVADQLKQGQEQQAAMRQLLAQVRVIQTELATGSAPRAATLEAAAKY